MKKILVIFSILLAMDSCIQPQPSVDTNIYHEVEKTNDVYRVYEYLDLKDVVIDSCEYLIGRDAVGGYGYMAHKGSCKYCAERRKRELQNLK